METTTLKIHDRHQAGVLLAQKLKNRRKEDTVITAVSKGGVIVAQPIAEILHAPLEVVPCKRIIHPSDAGKTIAAVGLNNIIIYTHARDLPQDYIQHQVISLQEKLRQEMDYYQEDWNAIPIEGRNIVLIDDLIVSGNTMMTCIQDLRQRNPASILVATPFVSAEAHFFLEEFVDDIVFIRMETQLTSPTDFYGRFPAVDEQEVKDILTNSKRYYLELL